MNLKLTIILLVVLALAAGVYVWIELSGSSSSKPGDHEVALLPEAFSLAELDVFHIRRGEQTYQFTNDQGQLKQTSPFELPVSEVWTDKFIQAISDLKSLRRIDLAEIEGASLSRVGLEPAEFEIGLPGQDGKAWSLKIGHQLTDGRCYALVESNDGESQKIHLISRELRDLLASGQTPWLNESYATLPWPDVHELQVVEISQGEKIALQLQRNGADWQFKLPAHSPVETDALAALLTRLKSFRPVEIHPAGQYADVWRRTAQQQRVLLTTGTGQTIQLAFKEHPDHSGQTMLALDWAGEVGNVIFLLHEGLNDRYLQAKTYRSQRPIEPIVDQAVAFIRYANAASQSVSQDESGAWQYSDGTHEFLADPQWMRVWIQNLQQIKVKDFLDPPTETKPAMTLVVADVAGRTSSMNLFSQKESKSAYPWILTADAYPEIAFALDENQAAVLGRDLRSLRHRRVLRDVPGQLAELVIEIEGEPNTTISLVNDKPEEPRWLVMWKQSSNSNPNQWQNDQAAFLFSQLQQAEAEAWLPDMDLTEKTNLIHLKMKLIETVAPKKQDKSQNAQERAEEKEHEPKPVLKEHQVTLTIDSHEKLAQIEGIKTPFRISNELLNLITREYRDTRLIPADPSKLKSIQLPNGIQISFNATGVTTHPEDTLADDDIKAIADLFTPLTADRLTDLPPQNQLVTIGNCTISQVAINYVCSFYRDKVTDKVYAQTSRGTGILSERSAKLISQYGVKPAE